VATRSRRQTLHDRLPGLVRDLVSTAARMSDRFSRGYSRNAAIAHAGDLG
jgi:hypothetical protein